MEGWGLEFSGCGIIAFMSTDFDDDFQLPEDFVVPMGFREVLLDECFADVSLNDFTEGRVEQNYVSFSVLVICGRT